LKTIAAPYDSWKRTVKSPIPFTILAYPSIREHPEEIMSQPTELRAVYYDALQAYDIAMKEYYAIVGKCTTAVPTVAVPPIIGATTVIVAAGVLDGPPPLAPVSAIAFYPDAPRSPRMTPMAATPSVNDFPQMRRFNALGQELPTNAFPSNIDMSWLMLP